MCVYIVIANSLWQPLYFSSLGLYKTEALARTLDLCLVFPFLPCGSVDVDSDSSIVIVSFGSDILSLGQ